MNKYCSKCGAKLFAEDRYCPECGCKCIEERTQSNIKTKKTTRTNSKESVKYNKTYIKYIYVAISLSVIIIAAIYYVPLIAQEIAWNNATRENNIDSYNKYLEIYPEGEHSSSAIEKRDKCVKEYDKYFENGNHLFNQDDFHGALREYSEALRINPKSFGVI